MKLVFYIKKGDYEKQNEALKFNYQMLSRLQSDCKYYLGYGNRHKKHLYFSDEQQHINEMKKLYNSFPLIKNQNG